ncbi:MAG: GrpB family protein [Bacillaceae bacterium]|jgi:Uncharacterized conserved protein|uniref:GrpB family protein n=2 Tax=Aeribacillus TaxID=1055323 RepID=A0A161YVD7_9BACI|nr:MULTISPECIES: GrpB family protein [Aeribacillus]REJ17702.1 MAG: GrpB family protein [Bacillaceae bacterium]KZN97945.1 hypothetical protein AZI98_01075 [Aeribacillus pallidus]MDR9796339.1 GrpB family protein [Aeribacillus pallidus]MED0702738.1 GrpB family protein [Aeribacillus composti]MED0715703.1 GrpB family protein [Aeribacillus composti]
MRKTIILPWTEEWEKSYKKEAKILKAIFKDEIVDIFHIGSTSIPTIGYAKPIIDILIVVKDIEKVDLYNGKMKELGYEPRGENGISGRRYFPKGQDNRTHHVHIYQIGHENIEKHLLFKEYMIKNPDEAKKYGELKMKLAKQFPDHTHQYQKGKESFVNEMVEKSLKWASKNNK